MQSAGPASSAVSRVRFTSQTRESHVLHLWKYGDEWCGGDDCPWPPADSLQTQLNDFWE